ncbi:hypothetical protein EV193_101200 [Herbihabitans rhizosphaerae]|uniref:Uncharacterized protein n=1 Tax=Herbihabitans rhizosphaerae TaxID=1872711 RepID=A0A4Q7L4V2_9PSEU|nr:hypothetical protein [Herbihabitans rhizosphaerae]RZS44325.1 hypothetical protein EV193_101200 [Herbihabitans rhizosphaerae]
MTEGYARLYGPLAVVTVLAYFLPITDRREIDSVAEMTVNDDPIAAVATFVLVALVGCLVAATLRPATTIWLPAWIAITSGMCGVMLLQNKNALPGKVNSIGAGIIVLALGTTVLAVAHAVHLIVIRERR